ncbi:MAG TPA: hypothetical protein VKY73_00795 [Polyangiaceae bacterium]|nr:hypothetical protein [Polyangiaceae bacterium]
MADPPEEELVPVPRARPPDVYEAKYMAGEGAVLYRDKSRAPWGLHVLFGLATALTVASVVASGELLALAVSLPVMALLWLFFSVLRVTVSEGHINVQYGIVGPKIPIEAVESVEAVRYDWRKFGGWGIRYAEGTWLYNMPGDGGQAIRVVWRNARGQRKVTLIGSRRAEELAHEVMRARRARSVAPALGEAPPRPDPDEPE